MKTLIIDRQELFRKALKDVVLSLPDMEAVLEAGNAEQAVSAAVNPEGVSLVLTCPHLFGLENRACAEIIQKLFPASEIILINEEGHGDDPFHSGTGRDIIVVTRESSRKKILNTLTEVIKAASSHKAENSGVSQYSTDVPCRSFGLTKRQKRIVEMMTQGLSNKEIAAKLDISEGTVKAHSNAVFRKLDVTSRTQAVLAYMGLNRPLEKPPVMAAAAM